MNAIAETNIAGLGTLFALGNLAIVEQPLLAVFASVKCPAALILKAHDTARELSESGQAVIGGFQSPAEKEMLTVLLRGQSPIVICPARGLGGMRIPANWQSKLDDGLLLILSPFPNLLKRPTEKETVERNKLVFRLAQRSLFIYASPGGKIEQLCREEIQNTRTIWTINSEHNQALINMGAQIWPERER